MEKLRREVWSDDESGAVDVVALSEAIPVDGVMDAHLTPVLAELLEAAAKRGMRQADAQAKAPPGFDWTLADQIAHEWALTQAGQLVTGVSARARRAIRDVVALGVRENHTIAEIAKNLRAVIGLTPREARSVARMRRQLIRDGLSASEAERRVGRRADVLVRRRAKLIAQHETAMAVEQGKLHEWRIMVAQGDLPGSVKRKWIARDACPLCRELARGRAVPLGEPFRTAKGDTYQSPPAHPRCKCSVVLIMGGRAKAAEDAPATFRRATFRPPRWGVTKGVA